MEQIAGHLLGIIEQARPLLHEISAEEASVKPGAERWSKQEILGHLIDSAGNNQQKFLRAMQAAGGHGEFVGYAQDFWVNAQHYNTANCDHLKHHLNQILPEAGFKSSFENLY